MVIARVAKLVCGAFKQLALEFLVVDGVNDAVRHRHAIPAILGDAAGAEDFRILRIFRIFRTFRIFRIIRIFRNRQPKLRYRFRAFDPVAVLHPRLENPTSRVAAHAVGVFVVPDERIPCAAKILRRIRRFVSRGLDRRQRLGARKRPVRRHLAGEKRRSAGGVLKPAARHFAAQRGNLVAPARLDAVERLVEASARPQLRPLPLRVPLLEEVGLAGRGPFVVLVVGEEPHVVRVARLHLRQLPRHHRFALRHRLHLVPCRNDAERLAAASVVRTRPHEQARAALRCLPPEQHRNRAIPAHVNTTSAASGVGVVPLPRTVRVHLPDRRRMRVPVVGAEQDMLHAHLSVGRDDAPRDAGVVRHQHRARLDSPAVFKFTLRVDAAAKLL